MEAPGTPQMSRTTVLPAAARYGRSFAVGAGFAVAWTPCIGPILGAILLLAASSGTVLHGAALLLAWSAGLGVPFLLAGLGVGELMAASRRARPLLPAIEVVAGVLVILVGILVLIDRFTVFNQYFAPGARTVVEAEGAIEGLSLTGPVGFATAFLAGVIAFISPCCLPLVPVYLGHLAGVTAAEDAGRAQRLATLRHAAAFVVGFSVVFVLIGASVGVVGYLVQDNLAAIQKVAGIALIVLGLNLAGAIRVPLLYRTWELRPGG
ncbi:MAG: cytochrome c biogenesis protein CcdA [Dehalococcoidia bacterium]